jgi:hypothetical protein
MALVLGVASGAGAEEAAWRVSKSSGDVWMGTTGVQPVSLKQEDALKPGDTIRTGRNGRVLLVRGEETILVSPNSVIGLPSEKKEGLSTTIVQQAGSILLEVEKRNVKHFEVETPYLAAVVKGTQFRVSVNAAGTSVDVVKGQVEVADFRTGQIAQVMPGQQATAFANGKAGLSLSGSGTLSPIEQGRPRASSIERVPVPKAGLSAPRQASNSQTIRAFRNDSAAARLNSPAAVQPKSHGGVSATRHGVTRISSSLGEVRLNFQKVTHGLARGSASAPVLARSAANKDTVWSAREARASTGLGDGSHQGNANDGGNGNGNAGAAVGASVAAAAMARNNSDNGNGNGGNANGNGANANGNGANGGGNGNNGHGHGNGHGNGRGRH